MALPDPPAANVQLFTKPPKTQPTKWKRGQLTSQQLEDFFVKGFVIIKDFFDTVNELDPVRRDTEELVDQLAQKLFEAGKIKDLYKDYGLFKRLTKLEEDFPGATIVLHKYGYLPEAYMALWSNDRLLNIMEQVLGTEDIKGHPVWNLRTKTPQNEASNVPWHQDVAYLDTDSYSVMQATAWIPLLDATEQNGCMQVVEGGHRTARVATHQGCYGNTWYVMLDEEEMEKALDVNLEKDTVTCEIPYGGMLLLNNMLPHRSLNNLSNNIRWSLDLRWQRADKPVGFYGLKDGIRMRSSSGPIKIDWQQFDRMADFQPESEKDTSTTTETSWHDPKTQPKLDIEDTAIAGPWMRKWEIVNSNRHTARCFESNDTHQQFKP